MTQERKDEICKLALCNELEDIRYSCSKYFSAAIMNFLLAVITTQSYRLQEIEKWMFYIGIVITVILTVFCTFAVYVLKRGFHVEAKLVANNEYEIATKTVDNYDYIGIVLNDTNKFIPAERIKSES